AHALILNSPVAFARRLKDYPPLLAEVSMQATKFSADSAGLHVVVYPGDNKILIAMSLDDSAVNDTDKNLAGFAIWRAYDGKPEAVLPNRISFAAGAEWTDSDK